MEQREANLIIVAVSLQEGGGGEVGGSGCLAWPLGMHGKVHTGPAWGPQ